MGNKKFDVDQWKAERTAKLATAKEALQRGLSAIQTGDDWRALLEGLARLGKFSPLRYSFANQVLLVAQGADLRGVGGFDAWKRAGRSVRKGAKARVVLAPVTFKVSREDRETGETIEVLGRMFRTISVFDYSQTEGVELKAPELPRVDAPEAFENSIETLRAVALALEGSPVSAITFVESSLNGANGWYDRLSREIVVVTGSRSRADIFRTLVHETAHAILHGNADHHERPVKEVEAESTAFVVAHALGLETGCYSFPYVAIWAQNGGDAAEKIAARVGDRIMHAAGLILDALTGAEQEAPALRQSA